MPDFATGKTRTATVSGTVQWRQSIEWSVPGEHERNYPWHTHKDGSAVSYFNQAVTVSMYFTYTRETRDNAASLDPNEREVRWIFTPHITGCFSYSTPANLVIAGDPVETPWFPYQATSFGLVDFDQLVMDIYAEGSATASFNETSTAHEWISPSPFAAYEKRMGVSYSCTAGGQITCDVIIPATYLLPDPDDYEYYTVVMGVDESYSYTQPADGSSYTFGNYDYGMLLGGGNGSFIFNGVPVSSPASNGGASLNGVSASINVSLPGTEYPSASVSCSDGGATLSGSLTSAKLQVANTIYYHNSPSAINSSATRWAGFTYPSATIQVYPSRSYNYTVSCTQYGTGDLLPADINHAAGGGWTADTPYTYGPINNYSYGVSDGSISYQDSAGNTLGTLQSLTSMTNTTPSGNANVANTRTLGAVISPTWADNYGTLLDSSNASLTTLAVGPRFQAAQITLEDHHQFQLFRSTSKWAIHTGSAFYGFNSGHSSTGATLAMDGSNLKVTVTAPKVLLKSTANVMRHIAYRYGKLRLKANVAGARVRLCMDSRNLSTGTPPFNFSWTEPAYAWEFTVGAADTWESIPFDFLLPQLQTNPNVFQLTWEKGNTVVHPGSYPIDSAPLFWLEFLDIAEYTLDHVEGYYRPDSTLPLDDPNRTPATLLYPIECFGDGAVSDTPLGSLGAYTIYLARLIVNGARSLTLTVSTSSTTVKAYWDAVRLAYDNSLKDTGITITVADTVWTQNCPMLRNGALTGGQTFGEIITPGTPYSIEAQWHVTSGYDPYPGAGVLGVSSGTPAMNYERVFDGEYMGIVHLASRALKGVTLTLHDNDTGTAMAPTASTDADGFYRLFGKYGADVVYSNVSSGGSRYQGTTSSATALGKQLNSHWLKGKRLNVLKDSSSYVKSGSFRATYPIHDRWAHPRDWDGTGDGEGNWIVQTPGGQLHIASTNSLANCIYNRSDHASKPHAISNVLVTSGNVDQHPRMIVEPDEIIRLLFCRVESSGGSNVYETYSSDSGSTWSTPTVAFISGERPHIAQGANGEILRAAIVGASIRATMQYPGEAAPSAEFTFADTAGVALQFESTSFCVAQAYEGAMRWWGIFLIAGETSTSDWVSSDDCRRWLRVT